MFFYVTDYTGNYIYKNGQLQYMATPEGYATPEGNSYRYVYQFKDHLDNVRLSYTKNDAGTLEIVEESNYYPFGLTHKGYNSSISSLGNSTAQLLGFGGKEEQNELGLGWIDITARNYDPALGRWMNLDPLAEQMRRHSPYNFAFDNPIFFIDPDGMKPYGTDPIKKIKRAAHVIKESLIASHGRNKEGITKITNKIKAFFAKGENTNLVGNEKQTAKGGVVPFVSKEFKKDGIATPNTPESGADITSGDGDGIAALAESQPGPDLNLDKTTGMIVSGAQLVDKTVSTVKALSGNNSSKGSMSTTNTEAEPETTTVSVTNVVRVDKQTQNGKTVNKVVTATKDTVVNISDKTAVQNSKRQKLIEAETQQ